MYTSLYIVMTLNTRVTNDKTASRLKSCSDQKKKKKYEHQQCWQHPNGEKANQGVRMRERNSI